MIMYATAMGNTITAFFQCLSAISALVSLIFTSSAFCSLPLKSPLCIGKLLFQLRQNFVLQVFDFYRLILYFYHQVSHMAEFCHINIKRRLGRHILFPNKVL